MTISSLPVEVVLLGGSGGDSEIVLNICKNLEWKFSGF